jgi:hypothetical protein
MTSMMHSISLRMNYRGKGVDVDGGEILKGQIHDFEELEKINAGEVSKPANKDIEVIGLDNEDDDVKVMNMRESLEQEQEC